MASTEAIRQQVLGILTANEVPVRRLEDGGFAAPGPVESSSVAVFVNVYGNGQNTFVGFSSPILHELPTKGEILGNLTISANALNIGSVLGRFVHYPHKGRLVLEYELIADELQEAEFMTALFAIANRAETLDDELKEFFGAGKRYFEDEALEA